MNKLLQSFLMAAALGALAYAPAAMAQAATPQQRLDEQQQRINNGVRSGQLTQGEAARDEAHDERIQAARNRDKAANGGHLTQAERSNLNHRLNNNSARIYDTKHNGKVAPPH